MIGQLIGVAGQERRGRARVERSSGRSGACLCERVRAAAWRPAWSLSRLVPAFSRAEWGRSPKGGVWSGWFGTRILCGGCGLGCGCVGVFLRGLVGGAGPLGASPVLCSRTGRRLRCLVDGGVGARGLSGLMGGPFQGGGRLGVWAFGARVTRAADGWGAVGGRRARRVAPRTGRRPRFHRWWWGRFCRVPWRAEGCVRGCR